MTGYRAGYGGPVSVLRKTAVDEYIREHFAGDADLYAGRVETFIEYMTAEIWRTRDEQNMARGWDFRRLFSRRAARKLARSAAIYARNTHFNKLHRLLTEALGPAKADQIKVAGLMVGAILPPYYEEVYAGFLQSYGGGGRGGKY